MSVDVTSYLGLRLPIANTGEPFSISDYRTNLTKLEDRVKLIDQTGTTEGSWTPVLGGSNASMGSAGNSTDGQYEHVGGQWHLRGRLVFGSGATFGNGTPVIAGFPINFLMPKMNGIGQLRRFSVNDRVQQQYIFSATANGAQAIIQVPGSPPQLAGGIALQQSDELIFDLWGQAQ